MNFFLFSMFRGSKWNGKNGSKKLQMAIFYLILFHVCSTKCAIDKTIRVCDGLMMISMKP